MDVGFTNDNSRKPMHLIDELIMFIKIILVQRKTKLKLTLRKLLLTFLISFAAILITNLGSFLFIHF